MSKDINPGDLFTTDNIRIIRPGDGLNPSFFTALLGKKAHQAYKSDQPLIIDGLT